MMNSYRFFILAFALLMAINVFSQKQNDWIELGDQAYEIGDFYGARHYFENALEMDSAKADLQYKYAETLRSINDYVGAERQYHKVFRKDRGRFYPKGIYWIAKMNEYIGDYDKAIEFWRKYKSGNDSEMKKRVNQRVKSCEFALQNKDSLATEIEVINAGRKINSAESEFSIVSIGDSILYYSSLRGDYNDDDVLLERTYDIQIYKSTLKRKFNRYTVGKAINEKINVPEMITANGCFNGALTLFFYSQCDQGRNCNIMVADFADGKFSNSRKLSLKINTPNSNCTQPNLAKIDGQEYLFFSANRPGGEGQNDIWFCKINGEEVEGEVQNMGPQINTPDNEISPFFDPEKPGLYFSSDWHEGFGGFDIFFSGGFPLTYTVNPINLLAPYNSSANDMYYWKNDFSGFLTSNRAGALGERGETCCNDIWIFRKPMEEDSLIVENKDEELMGENGEISSIENQQNTVEENQNIEANNQSDKEIILPEINTIEDLSKYLPITLYFDNDYPNPNTLNTTTEKSYSQTFDRYFNLLDIYKSKISEQDESAKKISEEAISNFFVNDLKKGHDDLDFFCRLIERELIKGRSLELAIKGYASPLSNSAYNENLTLRRIRSLINEMQTWNNGALKIFIEGGEDLGKLSFKEIPYGESKASSGVSDNTDNRAKSVYSPEAAKERRIEILEVK